MKITSSGFCGLRTEENVWTHGYGGVDTLELRSSCSARIIVSIMKSRGMGRLKNAAHMG
jgi:hypothetical protein